jgi:hypothetical protein
MKVRRVHLVVVGAVTRQLMDGRDFLHFEQAKVFFRDAIQY